MYTIINYYVFIFYIYSILKIDIKITEYTCPDTFAPSYSTIAAKQGGAVAQQAEEKKMQKYKHLDSCHFFTPVAIETTGVFGPKATEFLKELGH